MKILIIDESLTAREYIKEELEEITNVQLLEAKNGQDGMKVIREKRPDIVTINLYLSDGDGISLVSEIRDTPEVAQTPVIIISTETNDELIRDGFDAGVNEFFLKPFDPGTLRLYVENIFETEKLFEHLNILVVDDSKTVRMIIASILTIHKANVIEAEDGKEAIDILNNNPDVDLIVTDYIMPEVNGIELCQYVRRTMKRSDMPFIVLTSVGDQSTILEALNVGANDYLTKPFSRKELLARIRNHAQVLHFNKQLQKEIAARKQAQEKLEVAYKNIKEQQEQLLEELEQARETQKSILPYKLPSIPNATVASKYVPMEQIGGDFYDVFRIGQDRIGLMIADVTGHGVPAALISFMISGTFSDSVQTSNSPQTVIRLTNELLEGRIQEGKFATMFYGIYDIPTQTLTYTNGGHPPPYVIRPSTKEIFELKTKGVIVGQFPSDFVDFEEKKFHFLPGDKLLLYTDAIYEVVDENDEIMPLENLIKFIRDHSMLPVNQLLEEIYHFGLDYSDKDIFDDDITLVGMDIH